MIDRLPHPAVAPRVEIALHRGVGGQVLGQQAPLATGLRGHSDHGGPQTLETTLELSFRTHSGSASQEGNCLLERISVRSRTQHHLLSANRRSDMDSALWGPVARL